MLNLNKEEKEVVKKVIEDLQNRITIFNGKYSGYGTSGYFVQGIGIAMEIFGTYVGEDYADKIYDDFIANMTKSEREYELKQYEKSREKFS